MRTELRLAGDQPWFVVLDLDEVYHPAARALGYQDIEGGFGSECPKDSPHIQLAYANFERFAETMIRQTAGVEPVPWERAILELLRRMDGSAVDWWLTGSAALAARGLTVVPRDIDLIVSDETVHRLEDLMLDCLVQPVIESPGWVHNSFARAFPNSRVEWVGGVCAVADEQFASDQGPIAQSRLETVVWRGYPIRVPPLELQLETSRRRGLAERAALIEQALQRGPSSQL